MPIIIPGLSKDHAGRRQVCHEVREELEKSGFDVLMAGNRWQVFRNKSDPHPFASYTSDEKGITYVFHELHAFYRCECKDPRIKEFDAIVEKAGKHGDDIMYPVSVKTGENCAPDRFAFGDGIRVVFHPDKFTEYEF